MEERFVFTNEPAGLELMLRHTLSLRRNGFRTFVTTENIVGFTVHVLHAVPPRRPNREARGCNVSVEAAHA